MTAVLFIEAITNANTEVATVTKKDYTIIRHRLSQKDLTLLCVYTVWC